MHKYKPNQLTKQLPNNISTIGATEPIMSVLELGGFELRDFFLIGFNDDCGNLIVETQQRAREAANVLEPAYACTIQPLGNGDWNVDYSRRDRDGTAPSRAITDITLTDGTVVMRNGRPTS